VTGASAGIGESVALKLTQAGVEVALLARDRARLILAAERIEAATGLRPKVVVADVTRSEEIKAAAAEAQRLLGRIDILVNNAGNGIYKPFLDVTDEELVSGMEINFFAMFRMCREVIPMMIAQGGGSILNVTGISASSAMAPPFYNSCTGPAKAAGNRLTKTLAAEFGQYNIRVNAVSPGRINAPERLERWREKVDGGKGAEMSVRDMQRLWGRQISLPDHRWGEVDEIANLVVYAASDSCGFMTGAILVADGGESHD
jgi:NAD(P)-dependent dehydrogenase (short-subunit alcohol dehydrogenase family)